MNGFVSQNNNQTFYGVKPKQDIIYFQNQTDSAIYQNMTMDTLNNYNNKINNISFNYNNYANNYPLFNQPNKIKSRKPKKKVKFNEVVDVILVKSYKKYNQTGEEISFDDNFDENNKNNANNNIKKKNKKNCECNIF